MPRQCSIFLLLAALSCGLFASAPARAYEEQASLDLALGYAAFTGDQAPAKNLLSADLGGGLGIADWLVLRAALGYAARFDADHASVHAGRLRFEGAYLIDVLRWVPFFGLGGGLWALGEPSGLTLSPAGHLLFGVDYLATRSWTLGCDVRTGILWEHRQTAPFTEVQLRISRMFELF
jgi:hypothetical protein